MLERHGPAWWPRGFEELEQPRPVRSGQGFVVEGVPWRFHGGHGVVSTRTRDLDLLSADCCLDLELADEPRLLVHEGDREVTVKNAACWVLVPYFEARLTDVPLDGWLALDEAWARLEEIHPALGERRDRVTEDRSRVKRALTKAGVDNANALFEVRRSGGRGVRVAPGAGRLALVDG